MQTRQSRSDLPRPAAAGDRPPDAIVRMLLALLAVTAALAACATPGTPGAPKAVEVAPGVYMVRGAAGEVDGGNLGRTGNAGFIVGPSGVVAIDTGTSYRHGVALLDAIARVTDKPVRLALVTHTRQEFLFGAAAYRERGIPVHMHEKASGLMASRCQNCLKTLDRLLGEGEMRGTTMFKPDREFDGSHEIDSIGSPVRVLYYGHSSGPGDVAVLDPQTGVLFAGGLLDHRRIPDVQDCELEGWKRALEALRQLPVTTVVPGHGPAAPAAQAIGAVERYLQRLESRVRELQRAGVPLSEAPDAAELPEFKDWDQYDTIHRRNASVVYLRLEREEMFK